MMFKASIYGSVITIVNAVSTSTAIASNEEKFIATRTDTETRFISGSTTTDMSTKSVSTDETSGTDMSTYKTSGADTSTYKTSNDTSTDRMDTFFPVIRDQTDFIGDYTYGEATEVINGSTDGLGGYISGIASDMTKTADFIGSGVYTEATGKIYDSTERLDTSFMGGIVHNKATEMPHEPTHTETLRDLESVMAYLATKDVESVSTEVPVAEKRVLDDVKMSKDSSDDTSLPDGLIGQAVQEIKEGLVPLLVNYVFPQAIREAIVERPEGKVAELIRYRPEGLIAVLAQTWRGSVPLVGDSEPHRALKSVDDFIVDEETITDRPGGFLGVVGEENVTKAMDFISSTYGEATETNDDTAGLEGRISEAFGYENMTKTEGFLPETHSTSPEGFSGGVTYRERTETGGKTMSSNGRDLEFMAAVGTIAPYSTGSVPAQRVVDRADRHVTQDVIERIKRRDSRKRDSDRRRRGSVVSTEEPVPVVKYEGRDKQEQQKVDVAWGYDRYQRNAEFVPANEGNGDNAEFAVSNKREKRKAEIVEDHKRDQGVVELGERNQRRKPRSEVRKERRAVESTASESISDSVTKESVPNVWINNDVATDKQRISEVAERSRFLSRD